MDWQVVAPDDLSLGRRVVEIVRDADYAARGLTVDQLLEWLHSDREHAFYLHAVNPDPELELVLLCLDRGSTRCPEIQLLAWRLPGTTQATEIQLRFTAASVMHKLREWVEGLDGEHDMIRTFAPKTPSPVLAPLYQFIRSQLTANGQLDQCTDVGDAELWYVRS